MSKGLLLIVSILLLITPCLGQSLVEFTEEFSLQLKIPLGNISGDLEIPMYIVYGSELDTLERLILDSLNSDFFDIQPQIKVASGGNETAVGDIKIIKKLFFVNETSLEGLGEGTSIIILVGDRGCNRITDEVYEGGFITNESTKLMGQLVVGRGDVDSDSSVLVLYHRVVEKGERLEREAVKYSPLRSFMSEEYVPVVATGIGMFLMSLFNIFKTVAEFLALDIGRKKRKFGHTGPRIRGVYLKEVAAIFGAAFVLGFAVTWTFAGPTSGFLNLLILNAGICLFAALSHELSHRVIGRLFGIEIEYRFWYAGSFITLLTAFLGNSFGIQGFLMERVKGDISRWKYAVTKLAAPLVSITITVVFARLYLGNPGVIYQMIYTTASIWAMAEIMPVRGLDGYDIRRWSRFAWFIFFILISVIFFSVNFIQ